MFWDVVMTMFNFAVAYAPWFLLPLAFGVAVAMKKSIARMVR